MAVIKKSMDSESAPEKIGTRFTVKDPHPDFGIDPNIKNEYGHTNYPKWIEHPTKKRVDRTTTYIGRDQSVNNVIATEHPEMVLVHNEKEEKELLGENKKPKAWDK